MFDTMEEKIEQALSALDIANTETELAITELDLRVIELEATNE